MPSDTELSAERFAAIKQRLATWQPQEIMNHVGAVDDLRRVVAEIEWLRELKVALVAEIVRLGKENAVMRRELQSFVATGGTTEPMWSQMERQMVALLELVQARRDAGVAAIRERNHG